MAPKKRAPEAPFDPTVMWQDLQRLVTATFPKAAATEAYGMHGWRIPIPSSRVPPKVGTMDPEAILILLREGRSGPTLHIWNPLDPDGLKRHRWALEAAGFEVMVGCLRHSWRPPYPVDALRPLLREMRQGMRGGARRRAESTHKGKD